MTDKLRKAYRFATVPEHLIRDKAMSDRAVRLWCLLDRYAGKDDSAFPSRETLSQDLGVSRASVDRAVGELVTRGWLSKDRRYAGGVNEYTLLIAAVPAEGKKAQVSAKGVITGEDRGVSARVMTPPVLTGDDTPSAPAMTPVVTGAAQKEASSNEHQLTETSEESLRAASGEGESIATGDASSTRVTGSRDDVERLCQHLADRIEQNGANKPTITQKWRDAARLMIDSDGRPEDKIHAAINWCQDSEFWRGNILSMPKLRSQYETLRLHAMRDRGTAGNVHHLKPGSADHEELIQAFGG